MTTLKEEEPYAAVVHNEFLSSTCSKCFAWNYPEAETVHIPCAGCHILYYCSPECQKADWKDHEPECKLLRSAAFVPSQDARLVMRMMEKSKKQPDVKAFNDRTYDSLDHYSSMSSADSSFLNFWNTAKDINDEIDRFMASKAPDFETVFLALSKKAMNSFPIHEGTWTYNTRGTGIYLGLSVLNHSCRPDAFIVNQGSKMLLRTTKENCVYSDKLTISYHGGFFFMDTKQRRGELQNSHFFFCKCEECEDIESNKKKISGRPACCPDSWFSIAELICNNCKKELSSELAAKAEDAMERLRAAEPVFMKRVHEGTAYNIHSEGSDPLAMVPEWIQLFHSCKEVLSDENAYLFTLANMIYIPLPRTDLASKCKFVDWCLPQARKHPHCALSAILFARRHQYYEMAKKPLQEIKEAFNEALDSAQVVFGPQHEITQSLLEWKTLYDLDLLNLTTRYSAS